MQVAAEKRTEDWVVSQSIPELAPEPEPEPELRPMTPAEPAKKKTTVEPTVEPQEEKEDDGMGVGMFLTPPKKKNDSPAKEVRSKGADDEDEGDEEGEEDEGGLRLLVRLSTDCRLLFG